MAKLFPLPREDLNIIKINPFRPATLAERKYFYEKEFNFKKAMYWFGNKTPQLIAIDAGTETKTLKNKSWNNTLFYCYLSELKQKIKKYLPEDIYYDRNIYKKPELRFKNLQHQNFLSNKNVVGQELIFDVDADNISCIHPKNELVCNLCLQKTWQKTTALSEELKNLGFKKIKIVYSGKGFHLHIQDEKAYKFTKFDRINLIKKLSFYPIDSWVSVGNIELVRFPFSLNAQVSRIAIPIKNNFNSRLTIPKFLKNK